MRPKQLFCAWLLLSFLFFYFFKKAPIIENQLAIVSVKLGRRRIDFADVRIIVDSAVAGRFASAEHNFEDAGFCLAIT